jgi:hypothetical protein
MENNIYDTWEMKYDDKGNRIEMINFNPDGSVYQTRKMVHEFDKYNNWTKETIYVDNEPSTIIERNIDYYSN